MSDPALPPTPPVQSYRRDIAFASIGYRAGNITRNGNLAASLRRSQIIIPPNGNVNNITQNASVAQLSETEINAFSTRYRVVLSTSDVESRRVLGTKNRGKNTNIGETNNGLEAIIFYDTLLKQYAITVAGTNPPGSEILTVVVGHLLTGGPIGQASDLDKFIAIAADVEGTSLSNFKIPFAATHSEGYAILALADAHFTRRGLSVFNTVIGVNGAPLGFDFARDQALTQRQFATGIPINDPITVDEIVKFSRGASLQGAEWDATLAYLSGFAKNKIKFGATDNEGLAIAGNYTNLIFNNDNVGRVNAAANRQFGNRIDYFTVEYNGKTTLRDLKSEYHGVAFAYRASREGSLTRPARLRSPIGTNRGIRINFSANGDLDDQIDSSYLPDYVTINDRFHTSESIGTAIFLKDPINRLPYLYKSIIDIYRRNEDGSRATDNDGNFSPPIARQETFAATADKPAYDFVTTLTADGKEIATSVGYDKSPLKINATDVLSTIGSQLGYRIAGKNVVGGVVLSATLKTLGSNLGDIIHLQLKKQLTSASVKNALKNVDSELFNNLKSAGIGAISSFLTGELVNALGLKGIEGTIANNIAGTVIGQIASNLVTKGKAIFDGVNLTSIGSAFGGLIGSTLASKIVNFKSIGGQIGSAVGSALGVIAAEKLAIFGSAAGPLGTIAGAAIGAFVGFIVGGIIGSVFGGTPRSGADVEFDASTGRFVVGNVYSRKGGSKDAARSIASAVSETFNSVLDAAGGTLLDPHSVQTGNYGLRASAYVYRPSSTRSKDAISARFTGKNAAQNLIGYGVYQGLADPDFQIVGGDIFIKRAIYNSLSLGGIDTNNFDSNIIIGNIDLAQSYGKYISESDLVGNLY